MMVARSAWPTRRARAWLVGSCAMVVVFLGFAQTPAALWVAMPLAFAGCLVAVRWPATSALLLLASVPAQELGSAGPLTATRACLALALAVWAIVLLVQRARIDLHRFQLLYVALLVVMFSTITQARDWHASLAEIARWSIAFAAFVVLLQFFGHSTPRHLLPLIATVAALGALEALFGLAQSAVAAGPASFQIGAVTRAFGSFGRPNSFAGYLELTLFPTFWIGVHYLSLLPRALACYREVRLTGMHASRAARARLYWTTMLAGGFLSCAALMLAAVAASYSRGAWLGVAIAMGVTALLFARWARMIALILLPVGALILLGGSAQLVPGSINARIGSIVDEARPFDASSVIITGANFAAVERMAHWQAGWRMFEDHPVLGVGVGNFNTRYPDYYVRSEFRISQGHAHNIYIQMLAETGIAGLTAFLLLTLSFLALAVQVVLRAPPGFARMLALGAVGTLASVATHNVFEDLQVLNLGVQLAAIWVITIAAHRLWRAGEATSDVPVVEYSAA